MAESPRAACFLYAGGKPDGQDCIFTGWSPGFPDLGGCPEHLTCTNIQESMEFRKKPENIMK